MGAKALNEVVVRVGGPDDVDTAVSVYLRSEGTRHGNVLSDVRGIQVAATIRDPASWFFVALDTDETVGMAVAMPSRENFGMGPIIDGVCHLEMLFVVSERWGEGVGALLLDTVISDARLRRFTRIDLMTHEDNERAQALYARRGFHRTGAARMSSEVTDGIESEWVLSL